MTNLKAICGYCKIVQVELMTHLYEVPVKLFTSWLDEIQDSLEVASELKYEF
jgi:hypothetical protein